MSVTIETKGGMVAAVTGEDGAAVDFTVNDTSSTPLELVVKATVDAAHASNTPDGGAKAAAEAAANAVKEAADAKAAEFDDGDPTTNPTE